MSQSLDIIRHILDENLIDAKKATEGYLNDILSGAIKEQYKEVAPSLVEKAHEEGEKKKKKVKHMHDCAKKVVSEEWGEGTCIHGHHAEPDRNGFVAWYDVEFDHGIEEGVNVNDLKVLVSEMHHKHDVSEAATPGMAAPSMAATTTMTTGGGGANYRSGVSDPAPGSGGDAGGFKPTVTDPEVGPLQPFGNNRWMGEDGTIYQYDSATRRFVRV